MKNIILLNPYNNTVEVNIVIPTGTSKQWGSEKEKNNITRVTQMVNSRLRVWVQLLTAWPTSLTAPGLAQFSHWKPCIWKTSPIQAKQDSWLLHCQVSLPPKPLRAYLLSCFTCVQLFANLQTEPSRTLCPWDSPSKNSGEGYHFLLQEIFPTQGSNPCLLCLCIAGGFFTHWATLGNAQSPYTRMIPEPWKKRTRNPEPANILSEFCQGRENVSY